LLESELFGHERGAFTGAQQTRRGRFEQAEGGTLFLDEIGDMPAELQTRLLRVLSDGHFYRVGGHQPIKANVRVIAATHQNLEERVKQGLFREDLFHRLNVIRLRLPALRERPEDVALLVRHFLVQSARELGGEPKRVSEQAMTTLGRFSWPGNVRQLENTCRWLTVMSPTQLIDFKDLPPEVREVETPRLVQNALAVAEPPLMSTAPGFGGQAVPALAGLGSGAPLPLVGAVTDSRSDPSVRSQVPSEPLLSDSPVGASAIQGPQWEQLLEREVTRRLTAQLPEQRLSGESEVMASLTRTFEASIIRTALRHTRGRRIDAALRLGIGRNTITRKIQELRLEDDAGADS
jgi:two-component system nitrogen regulation response regulator GlnG